MKRFFLLLGAFFLASLSVSAQKTVIASGDYMYVVPKNVSMDQAEQIAVERAQMQIIADEFGSIVESFTTTRIQNENGSSQVSSSTLGSSEVRGEWLETIGVPTIRPSYEDGMLIIYVHIRGRIREIISAPIDFTARILCNGTEDRYEQSEFRNGDDLYLSFSSPAKGYLTVYLYDGNDKVYCLLPYQHQLDGMVEVDANKRYVFFSQALSPQSIDKQLVDEYTLTAERDSEFNRIYIVFSTRKYYKADDGQNGGQRSPRSLSYGDFQKWLAKNKKYDTEMRLVVKDIIINK